MKIEAVRQQAIQKINYALSRYLTIQESPAQFYREYSRKFKCSPVQHLVKELV